MLLLSMKNLEVLEINEADYETSIFEHTVPLANVPAETASDLTWGTINSS